MNHKNGLNAPNQAVNQRLSRNAMMGAYRLEKGNKGCFSPFSLAFAPPFPLLDCSTHPKGVRCPVGVDVFGVDFRAKWGFFGGGFPLLDT